MRSIESKIEINAPIQQVWKEIIDIQNWDWNKWTKLKCNQPVQTGVEGKMFISYDGDQNYKELDFQFHQINAQNYYISWVVEMLGSSMFNSHNSIQLIPLSESRTLLIHNENCQGLLVTLNLGLDYEKLDRNYKLMNEALKLKLETNKIIF
ncbi:hypothetical protein BC833DRAFT_623846 [Globomyces pollinis-pini]|nr:hypothetical protein BC833DRAFT_623846 [Globomyces pollinis-pini]KAJ2999334.1 hypothetical protein HDV02_003115 [Globomyces sp. JEL0801]